MTSVLEAGRSEIVDEIHLHSPHLSNPTRGYT
jgi:hypothetical protein